MPRLPSVAGSRHPSHRTGHRHTHQPRACGSPAVTSAARPTQHRSKLVFVSTPVSAPAVERARGVSTMGKSAKSVADPTNFSDAYLQSLNVLHEVGDHTPSVLLTVGDDRLCFNCGEGFQRCCAEKQVRLRVTSKLAKRCLLPVMHRTLRRTWALRCPQRSGVRSAHCDGDAPCQ